MIDEKRIDDVFQALEKSAVRYYKLKADALQARIWLQRDIDAALVAENEEEQITGRNAETRQANARKMFEAEFAHCEDLEVQEAKARKDWERDKVRKSHLYALLRLEELENENEDDGGGL